jgi:hypothetical protein
VLLPVTIVYTVSGFLCRPVLFWGLLEVSSG